MFIHISIYKAQACPQTRWEAGWATPCGDGRGVLARLG